MAAPEIASFGCHNAIRSVSLMRACGQARAGGVIPAAKQAVTASIGRASGALLRSMSMPKPAGQAGASESPSGGSSGYRRSGRGYEADNRRSGSRQGRTPGSGYAYRFLPVSAFPSVSAFCQYQRRGYQDFWSMMRHPICSSHEEHPVALRIFPPESSEAQCCR